MAQAKQYETELERRHDTRVNKGVSNDFVIAVTASGKSAVSGTGKTTLALRLAKNLDSSESGFNAEQKATLSIQEFTETVPEVENKSAIIYDEAQGTPGEGTGLDARRGMKDESIQAINGILANRNKNLTIIIVAQHLPMLDKRVPMLLDAWLMIRHGPDEPQGPLAVHHKVEVEDYDFSSPNIRTPGVEDLDWDALPANDPDYQALEQMKEQAKREQRRKEDDGQLSDSAQLEIARTLRENTDLSWRGIAEDERLTKSYEYYRQNLTD